MTDNSKLPIWRHRTRFKPIALVLLILFQIQSTMSSFPFPEDLPELWDPNKFNLHPLSVRYSKYREKPNQNLNVLRNAINLVPNLNEYIEMVQPDCLLHLINYEGIDFLSFSYPVILSRYDSLMVYYLKVPKDSNTLNSRPLSVRRRLFLYEQTPILTATQLKNGSRPVDHPKLAWCQRYFPEYQCNDIPFLDRVNKTRPWTCEAHLYLNPPAPDKDPLFYRWDSYTKIHRLEIPVQFRLLWGWGYLNEFRESIALNTKTLNWLSTNLNLFIVHRPTFQVLVTNSNAGTDSNLTLAWKDAILRLVCCPIRRCP